MGALCQECAVAGIKNKKDYPPKFWPGNVNCDGVIGLPVGGKWNYINHVLPIEDTFDPPAAEFAPEAARVPLDAYDHDGTIPF